jgi:hypothetical protein
MPWGRSDLALNPHALFFGSLIAILCGLIYHLLRGGNLARLMMYLITAWIMFFAGQWLSEQLGWRLMRVGSLNLFPSLLATFLGLILVSILARPDGRSESERSRRPPRQRKR